MIIMIIIITFIIVIDMTLDFGVSLLVISYAIFRLSCDKASCNWWRIAEYPARSIGNLLTYSGRCLYPDSGERQLAVSGNACLPGQALVDRILAIGDEVQ